MMLSYLKTLSTKRIGWILLLLSVIALESTALYFQHGMALAPCVMCIYERVALMGIGFSGFLGMLFSRFNVTRILALLIGLGSSVKGILLVLKHLDYQLNRVLGTNALRLRNFRKRYRWINGSHLYSNLMVLAAITYGNF